MIGFCENKHCYFRLYMNSSQIYHRSLIRLVVLNAISKPIWILGIDRWVQNEVGLVAYGGYFSVWGLTLTAGFLLDLGLTTLVQREGASKESSSRDLAGLFWMKTSLLILYFLSIALIGCFNPQLSTNWLWGIAIIQALNSLYVYFRAWVTAAQDYSFDVWFSVLDKLLLIPICILWLSGIWPSLPITLDVFIHLQIGSLLVSVGVILSYFFQKRIPIAGRFDLSLSRMRMAWPYALIVLLMSAHTRLDGFWLTQWSRSGNWEAGRYAAGYRLLDAANMFGYLVASFLLPYLSRHLANETLVRSAIRTARIGLLLFSVSLATLVACFAPSLSALLYPGDANSVASILPLLFGSLLGYSMIHVYGTVMTARGDLSLFQAIIAGALLLHLVLSFIWIPEMGAMGAARSALLSQVLAGSALTYFVHRRSGDIQPYASYIVIIFTTCMIWFFHH